MHRKPIILKDLKSQGVAFIYSSMGLTLSPIITELLKELAGDRDIEEFIIDLIIERLDPPRRVEAYLKLHEYYLRGAEELYSRGDLVQASEKYWGRRDCIAQRHCRAEGWEHYSHRDYDVIIDRLYEETGDKSIILNFGVARDCMPIFTITSWIGRHLKFIGRWFWNY